MLSESITGLKGFIKYSAIPNSSHFVLVSFLSNEEITINGMLLYKMLDLSSSIISQSFMSGNCGSHIIRSGMFRFDSQYIAVHPSGAVTTWCSLPRTVCKRNLIALLSSIARIFFFIFSLNLITNRNFSTGVRMDQQECTQVLEITILVPQ